MILHVKKLILLFLLALLPLQFSWAAAAVYCQHENEKSTHFGHHSHKHEVQVKEQSDDAKTQGKTVKFDSDCSFCHFSAQPSALVAHPILAPPTSVIHQPHFQAFYSSHIPDGPQKPDWRFVA